MSTYLTFFTYTRDAWQRMVQEPENREEAARAVVGAAGGDLVAFYWMLGEHDGIAIYDAPSPSAAAAVNAAIAASGQVAGTRTAPLLSSEEARATLELAQVVSSSYAPPGKLAEWRAGYDELG